MNSPIWCPLLGKADVQRLRVPANRLEADIELSLARTAANEPVAAGRARSAVGYALPPGSC